jgi:DNA-binding PadR family transcriptional regulator
VHATLLLLNEEPRHGYQIIAELEERSGGSWRPSPGSIYPALKRLAMKGLVEADEDDEGKRVFSITDAGRERLVDMDATHPAPWNRFTESGPGLRPVVQELMSLARQVGRFGTDEQRDKAMAILSKAKSELYSLMAGSDTGGKSEGEDR